MKIVKRLDVLIIIILLVISFVPYLIFKNKNKDVDAKEFYGVVSVDGEVVAELDLADNEGEEFMIETIEGNNKVVVKDGGISITEADCSDKVCISQGVAKKPGDMIVCLPHRVIIEIVGVDSSEKEQDIISQ